MNNRDLLKEAIADAKAVKETAIANAKAALEEVFNPMIREKLSAKLAEMDEMEEAEDKKVAEIKDEKEMKENFDMDESKLDEYAEVQPDRDDDGDGKLDLDEMDLDELLRELDDMEEGEDLMEGEDDLINDPKGPTAHGNVAEEEEAGKAEEEEDEEIDLENMSEDDLKTMIEDVIAGMVEAGQLEGNIEGEEGEEEGEEESEEEEINIDELVAELKERKKYGGNKGDIPSKKRGDKKDTAEEEGDEDYKKKLKEIYDIGAMGISDTQAILAAIAGAVGVPLVSIIAAYAEDKIRGVKDLIKGKKAGAMDEGDDMYEAEVDEMKEKLKEAYSTIETIKSDLNEVNLLNAKLLYTNKIFRAKNLTENQKVKVLEAFDKATTAKEANLVFETLSGEVKERKSSVTESMIGGASKAAGIAPSKKPILEVNDQFARWQHLAGITK